MNSHPLVWAEIDLGAIGHNVRELKRISNPESKLLIAVKANAYGHGMVEIARCGLENGAEVLGVARIDEGITLRKAGIAAPILIFGYTPPVRTADLVKYHLAQTLFSIETAEAMSSRLSGSNDRINVHIKIDTGMGRLGLLHSHFKDIASGVKASEKAIQEIKTMTGLPGLNFEGMMTHFASADSAEKSYTKTQFLRFIQFLDQVEKAGIKVPIRHAANSGAIIDMPETHLDMVRAGISVYGLYPSDEVNQEKIELRPAMSLKARIVHLKNVKSGFKVSYGMTYETPKPTSIATIPVGYADGFSRLMSNKGHMLVHGQKASIIGRVCMDLTMLDVGHIPEAALDDEVVIFGRQGDVEITADELASSLNTINYEIVSSLNERVPRQYL